MTDQYPLDAWGVEDLDPAAHRWNLLKSQVHGRREEAEQSRRELVSLGWDPKELRIVPLSVHRRGTTPTSHRAFRIILCACATAAAAGVARMEELNAVAGQGYPVEKALIGLIGANAQEVREAVARGELSAEIFIAAVHKSTAIDSETTHD